jgi:hypothetical protein
VDVPAPKSFTSADFYATALVPGKALRSADLCARSPRGQWLNATTAGIGQCACRYRCRTDACWAPLSPANRTSGKSFQQRDHRGWKGASRSSFLPLPCGLYARQADPIVRPFSAAPLAHANRAPRRRDADIPARFVGNDPQKACSEVIRAD